MPRPGPPIIPGRQLSILVKGQSHEIEIPGRQLSILVKGQFHEIEIPGRQLGIFVKGQSHEIELVYKWGWIQNLVDYG